MDTKKLALWQDAINKQKESKLSISQWCKENELNKGRFYYWNNRINKNKTDEKTSKEQVFAKVEVPKKHLSTNKESSNNAKLKLLWNGLEIIISNKDEIPLAADLIKQLQEIC